MQNGGEFIAVRTPRLLHLWHGRRGRLHRRNCLGSSRNRRGLTEIAQAAFQLLNALAQRPFKALRICNARLETHAPIIRLTQQPLEFRHMRAETLDDGVSRLLQLLFQLLNGFRKILIRLIAALTPMKNVAHDEQKNRPEDDECPQNFGNRNNNRTPPLSTFQKSKTDVKMHAATRIGS